jgi:hypothetical protein
MGIARLSLGHNFFVKSMSGTPHVLEDVVTPTQTRGVTTTESVIPRMKAALGKVHTNVCRRKALVKLAALVDKFRSHWYESSCRSRGVDWDDSGSPSQVGLSSLMRYFFGLRTMRLGGQILCSYGLQRLYILLTIARPFFPTLRTTRLRVGQDNGNCENKW